MFNRVLLALLILSSSIFLFAQSSKPNFSGTWKFNPHKSSLQIPAPSSSIFTIKHNEPKFSLSRTHVFDGESDTWEIDFTTDGKEVMQRKENTFIGRLYWDGNELILHSKIVLKDKREASNIVRYSLSEDKKVFTANEKLRGPGMKYDNVWVFDRIP